MQKPRPTKNSQKSLGLIKKGKKDQNKRTSETYDSAKTKTTTATSMSIG
jgi:hypothetical protein